MKRMPDQARIGFSSDPLGRGHHILRPRAQELLNVGSEGSQLRCSIPNPPPSARLLILRRPVHKDTRPFPISWIVGRVPRVAEALSSSSCSCEAPSSDDWSLATVEHKS